MPIAPAISGPNGLFPDAKTDLGQRIGGTIFSATVGGLASVAGGGKFANGAITAAFGHLFNQVAQSIREAGQNEAVVVINNNGLFGTHVGIWIGDTLYDPAGSYDGKDNYSLNDYLKYQSNGGKDLNIQIYRFNLSDEDRSSLLSRVDAANEAGGTWGGWCASAVQECLAGVGSFKSVSVPGLFPVLPGTLGSTLKQLGTGTCFKYGGGSC